MATNPLYRVEKGYPVPSGRCLYPFGEMEVGDSFEFGPGEDEYYRVLTAAHNYSRYHRLEAPDGRRRDVAFRSSKRLRRVWRVR